MQTVAEVLKQSGWSQEQIDALDAKAMQGFTGVLTASEQVQKSAQEAAAKAEADRKAAEAAVASAKAVQDATELQKRSVDEFWQNTYNPGVAAWEKEKQELARKASDAAAEAAFYKAQRESLKELGLIPADAPAFTPTAVTPDAASGSRDAQGRFVPGPSGSPVFDTTALIARASDGFNTIANVQWRYQRLYNGAPLPIPPSELISKADQLKLDPMEYAARTFRFAEKEEEQRQAVAKAHDDEIRAAAATEKESEWKQKFDAREAEFAAKEKTRAEQHANNPDVRVAISSKMPELQRQVVAKDIPDPLMMNESQRRAQTSKMIRDTIAEKDQAAA